MKTLLIVIMFPLTTMAWEFSPAFKAWVEVQHGGTTTLESVAQVVDEVLTSYHSGTGGFEDFRRAVECKRKQEKICGSASFSESQIQMVDYAVRYCLQRPSVANQNACEKLESTLSPLLMTRGKVLEDDPLCQVSTASLRNPDGNRPARSISFTTPEGLKARLYSCDVNTDNVTVPSSRRNTSPLSRLDNIDDHFCVQFSGEIPAGRMQAGTFAFSGVGNVTHYSELVATENIERIGGTSRYSQMLPETRSDLTNFLKARNEAAERDERTEAQLSAEMRKLHTELNADFETLMQRADRNYHRDWRKYRNPNGFSAIMVGRTEEFYVPATDFSEHWQALPEKANKKKYNADRTALAAKIASFKALDEQRLAVSNAKTNSRMFGLRSCNDSGPNCDKFPKNIVEMVKAPLFNVPTQEQALVSALQNVASKAQELMGCWTVQPGTWKPREVQISTQARNEPSRLPRQSATRRRPSTTAAGVR